MHRTSSLKKTATFATPGSKRANSLDITRLAIGATGRVVALTGGHHAVAKLEAMGIVPGALIVKKSASLLRGPIVVQKGALQLAIGYGLAKHVFVEALPAQS